MIAVRSPANFKMKIQNIKYPYVLQQNGEDQVSGFNCCSSLHVVNEASIVDLDKRVRKNNQESADVI